MAYFYRITMLVWISVVIDEIPDESAVMQIHRKNIEGTIEDRTLGVSSGPLCPRATWECGES